MASDRGERYSSRLRGSTSGSLAVAARLSEGKRFKPLQLRSGTPRGNYRVLNHTSVFDLVMFSACNEYRVLISN